LSFSIQAEKDPLPRTVPLDQCSDAAQAFFQDDVLGACKRSAKTILVQTI